MMRRTATSWLALLLGVTLLACSADDDSEPNDPRPAADAGTNQGGADAGVSRISEHHLREDFETRELIESVTDEVIVDINAGLVTLPAQTFPDVSDRGLTTLREVYEYNGRVEARTIIVLESATVMASDSIELRAKDTLRVSGRISAGAGGVDLVAGSAISIDGRIESEGPIRLRLADEDGQIRISGSVITLDGASKRSADIHIAARGAVHVSGLVVTGAAEYADSGGVTVTSYGPITVEGFGAQVASGASRFGEAGKIVLSTEDLVAVRGGAAIQGGVSIASARGSSLRAGDVTIRSFKTLVRSGGAIEGGPSQEGLGGTIDLVAGSSVLIEDGGRISAGCGRIAGHVQIEATTATIGAGATLAGGDGTDAAGRALIATAGNLSLSDQALVRGGNAACASGGDVVVLAAGRLRVDAGAALRGGNGGTEVGSSCFDAYAGGHVQVVAQDVIGPLETAAMGGDGSPRGRLSIRLDPRYTREPPDIRDRTTGWVISRPIDRGEEARGRAPELRELRLDTPRRTFAKLELFGSDDPRAEPTTWTAVDADTPRLLEALAGYRYFRYRVFLRGRALDAPVVDYFEIDLSPGP